MSEALPNKGPEKPTEQKAAPSEADLKKVEDQLTRAKKERGKENDDRKKDEEKADDEMDKLLGDIGYNSYRKAWQKAAKKKN